ncbi:hypothetical protein TWF506_009114 [Arthrobotrys conoides]|uniref:Uncharacterized protein n=1 Tax=Arthrobotrys conoides TaxID=74498 RepID=A0AAN8RXI8_9PEZI
MEEKTLPKSFHLVLCGAQRASEDSWFFGDFIGLCSLLGESGIDGNFISCYPVEEYFANPTAPSFIEFGVFRNSTKVTAAYTKYQHQLASPFYTQIRPADTHIYLLGWLKKISLTAQPGDTVSVWILSHGNSEGIALGGETLDPKALIKITKEFNDGVQVNIAFSACHPSKFSKAYSKCPQTFRYIRCKAEEYAWTRHKTGTIRRRNSRFIQATVNSVTGKGPAIQGYHYQRNAPNEDNIRDEIERKVSDPTAMAMPSFFKDGVPLISIVKNILFRGFKDITYDPLSASRRGRMEWPRRDDPVVRKLDTVKSYRPPKASRDEAVALFTKLSVPFPAHANGAGVFQCDWGFENPRKALWAEDTVETNCVVYAMYIRARLQSAIWDIIFSLSMDGYLDIAKVFVHPVPLNGSEKESRAFSQYLCHLEAISDFEDFIWQWPDSISPYLDCIVSFLLEWFSIVVIRGMTVPLVEILNYILDSEWFGGVDEERLKFEEKIYSQDIVDRSIPGINKVDIGCKLFGFFLPKQPVPDAESVDSLSLLERLNQDVVRNFAGIEEFTKRYFSWDDTVIALWKEDRWTVQLAKVRDLIPSEIDPEHEEEECCTD